MILFALLEVLGCDDSCFWQEPSLLSLPSLSLRVNPAKLPKGLTLSALSPLSFRVPGVWSHSSNGGSPSLTPSTSRRIIRDVIGFTGPRPLSKPYPIHPWSLHCYDYSLENKSFGGVGHESNFGPIGSSSASFHDLSLDKPSYNIIRNRAIDDLNDKVRGNLNLAVDFAESHQTRKMLRVSDQVVDYTRLFVKSHAFSKTRGLANLWLTYTYGVKPLLASLYGAADESLRVVINKLDRFRGRSSETVQNPRIIMDSIFGNQTFRATGSFKVSCTIGVSLYVPSFDITRWTTLNPLNLAWELTPYSFVVDWFLNVGSYLSNMETYLANSSRFRQGYETQLQAWNLSISSINTTFSDGFVNINTGRSSGVWIDRTILSDYPIPSLPSFKANLGSSRLVSAASLLAQLLKR